MKQYAVIAGTIPAMHVLGICNCLTNSAYGFRTCIVFEKLNNNVSHDVLVANTDTGNWTISKAVGAVWSNLKSGSSTQPAITSNMVSPVGEFNLRPSNLSTEACRKLVQSNYAICRRSRPTTNVSLDGN